MKTEAQLKNRHEFIVVHRKQVHGQRMGLWWAAFWQPSSRTGQGRRRRTTRHWPQETRANYAVDKYPARPGQSRPSQRFLGRRSLPSSPDLDNPQSRRRLFYDLGWIDVILRPRQRLRINVALRPRKRLRLWRAQGSFDIFPRLRLCWTVSSPAAPRFPPSALRRRLRCVGVVLAPLWLKMNTCMISFPLSSAHTFRQLIPIRGVPMVTKFCCFLAMDFKYNFSAFLTRFSSRTDLCVVRAQFLSQLMRGQGG